MVNLAHGQIDPLASTITWLAVASAVRICNINTVNGAHHASGFVGLRVNLVARITFLNSCGADRN
jgi:hypothetical protein